MDHTPRGYRTSSWLLLGLLGPLAGCATPHTLPPLSPNAIKPVIAVSSFENKSGYPGPWAVGSGMAELLLLEIVGSGRFDAVERINLDQVVGELALQESPYFRAEGRASPGALKSARYLIRGTITDFSQVRGGGFWLFVRHLFLFGRSSVARVALTLTIVDVATGEIVGSVQSDGEASASEASLEVGYEGVAFGGDVYFKTPIGYATREAIREALYGLAESMPVVLWRPLIAESGPERIVINGGADRGLRVGTVFQVRAPAHEVTDPLTGDPVTQLPGAVLGRIEIVEVLESAAFAIPLEGTGFDRGQWLEAP